MNQEKKAIIAAQLKAVMPEGWKYSLAVRNHSTIVLNITAAPVDLIKICRGLGYSALDKHAQLGPMHRIDAFKNTEVGELLAKIKAIMYGADYHDNSDAMTDYFDVAYYVEANIGKWNKPFNYLG